MNNTFIDNRLFVLLAVIIASPVVIMAVLSFYSIDGINQEYSLSGYIEILSSLRLNELMKISVRALIVSVIATIISFYIANVLVYNTSKSFQSFYLILVTLPFLANESVRVFSWQYILSENGIFNNVLSLIIGSRVSLLSSANILNVYFVMIVTCIPFGVFINTISLKIIPDIYRKVAEDLKINAFHNFVKIVLPLSKTALAGSLLVTYFISFSLSSEVNYLGGDSKISLRNMILSLMSASKFQSILSLGFLITIAIMIMVYIVKIIYEKKAFIIK